MGWNELRLKNPFNRRKLCVGGSGDAGFSSGSATGDSSYSSDAGSGSTSSVPGVSTYAGNESQAGSSNNSQAYTGVMSASAGGGFADGFSGVGATSEQVSSAEASIVAWGQLTGLTQIATERANAVRANFEGALPADDPGKYETLMQYDAKGNALGTYGPNPAYRTYGDAGKALLQSALNAKMAEGGVTQVFGNPYKAGTVDAYSYALANIAEQTSMNREISSELQSFGLTGIINAPYAQGTPEYHQYAHQNILNQVDLRNISANTNLVSGVASGKNTGFLDYVNQTRRMETAQLSMAGGTDFSRLGIGVKQLSNNIYVDERGNQIGVGETYLSTPSGRVTIPAAQTPQLQIAQNIALFGTATPSASQTTLSSNDLSGFGNNPAYNSLSKSFVAMSSIPTFAVGTISPVGNIFTGTGWSTSGTQVYRDAQGAGAPSSILVNNFASPDSLALKSSLDGVSTATQPRGAAYDIVAETYRTGGTPDPTLLALAVSQGYGGAKGADLLVGVDMMGGRNTVPSRSQTPGGSMVTDKSGRTTYDPNPKYADPPTSVFKFPGEFGATKSNDPVYYRAGEGVVSVIEGTKDAPIYNRMNPLTETQETWILPPGHSVPQRIGGVGLGGLSSGQFSFGADAPTNAVLKSDWALYGIDDPRAWDKSRSFGNYLEVAKASGSGRYTDVGSNLYGGIGGVDTEVFNLKLSSPGNPLQPVGSNYPSYNDKVWSGDGWVANTAPRTFGNTTTPDPRGSTEKVGGWWADALVGGDLNARMSTEKTPMLFQKDYMDTSVGTVTSGRQALSTVGRDNTNFANLLDYEASSAKIDANKGSFVGVDTLKNYGYISNDGMARWVPNPIPMTELYRKPETTYVTNPNTRVTEDRLILGGMTDITKSDWVDGKYVAYDVPIRAPNTVQKGGDTIYPAIINNEKYALAFGVTTDRMTMDDKRLNWQNDLAHNEMVKGMVADKTRGLKADEVMWTLPGGTGERDVPLGGTMPVNVGGVSSNLPPTKNPNLGKVYTRDEVINMNPGMYGSSEGKLKATDFWNAGANTGGSAFEKGVPIQDRAMSAFAGFMGAVQKPVDWNTGKNTGGSAFVQPPPQVDTPTPDGFVLDVAIGRLIEGKAPTTGELYNAMPIVRIAQNWTNTPGTVENATELWKENNPSDTEGLIRTAGIMPMGNAPTAVRVGSEVVEGVAPKVFKYGVEVTPGLEKAASMYTAPQSVFTKSVWGAEDPMLGVLAKERGFTGKPTVVTAEQFLETDGISIFRGVGTKAATNAYNTGDVLVGRGGMMGSGTYFGDNVAIAKQYGGGVHIIEAKIKPDAKIISFGDLLDKQRVDVGEFTKISPSGSIEGVFRDQGRYATALGYDAIYNEKAGYYSVLNRGATIIPESKPFSSSSILFETLTRGATDKVKSITSENTPLIVAGGSALIVGGAVFPDQVRDTTYKGIDVAKKGASDFGNWVTGGDTDKFVDTARQATGGRIQEKYKTSIDFLIDAAPVTTTARPIKLTQIGNATAWSESAAPMRTLYDKTNAFIEKSQGSAQTPAQPYSFGFGVQAANEGVNDIADYSTPTSIESGMNYGFIPKPFVSAGVSVPSQASPIPIVGVYLDLYQKRVDEEKTSTAKPSDNVFIQATNSATDATLGFIPGFFGVKFSPMADMNKAVGNANDNPALVNAQTPKATADYINYGRSIDFKAGSDYLSEQEKTNTEKGMWVGDKTSWSSLMGESSRLESARTANSKDGVWTGSKESYDTYMKDASIFNTRMGAREASNKQSLDIYNQQSAKFNSDISTQEDLFAKIGIANQADVKSGAYVIRDGAYVENQDMKRPYGSYSDWSQGASKVLQGLSGNTKEQFASQEVIRNAADKSNPITPRPELGVFGGWVAGEEQKMRNMDNAAFGFYKEAVTNPGGLITSAYSGAQMYAVTAGVGGFVGTTAQGTGKAATVSKALQTAGSYPIIQYGVPTAFIAKGAYDATEGFTLPASKSAMNVGSAGAHFASLAVGMGVMGGTSGVVDYKYGAGEYQSIGKRFESKPETRSVVTAKMTNEIRPDVTQPSGKVVEFTGEATITNFALPAYAGRTFPRLSNIKQVGTPTVESLTGVGGSPGMKYDAGGFFEGRLAGSSASIVPESGTRYYKMQIDQYKGEPTARGTGNVKTFQTEYPGTLDSYIKAGESYSNTQARRGYADRLSPEEATLGYIGADVGSVKITTSQRESSVSPQKQATPRGINDVFDAFDWNAVKEGGVTHELGRVTPFDYSEGLTFERKGGNARLEQKTVVERNAQSDTGIVSSDMTAKRKIVDRARDEGLSIKRGDREQMFIDDMATGKRLADDVGTSNRVQMSDNTASILEQHIDSGGAAAHGHTHPSGGGKFGDAKYIAGNILQDISTKYIVEVSPTSPRVQVFTRRGGLFDGTKRAIDFLKSDRSMPSHNAPKRGDIHAMSRAPDEITMHYITTRDGTRIIEKPNKPSINQYQEEGWGRMNEIGTDVAPLNARGSSTTPYTSLKNELLSEFKNQGVGTEYIPHSTVYRPSAETTTIKKGISQTMQNEIPSYMQKEVVNLGDRQVLHNSLLEFSRESPTPPRIKTIGGRVGSAPRNNQEFLSIDNIGGGTNDRINPTVGVRANKDLRFSTEPVITSKREKITANSIGSDAQSGGRAPPTLGSRQFGFVPSQQTALRSSIDQRQERVTARENVSAYKREVIPGTDSVRAFMQVSTPYRTTKQGGLTSGTSLLGVTFDMAQSQRVGTQPAQKTSTLTTPLLKQQPLLTQTPLFNQQYTAPPPPVIPPVIPPVKPKAPLGLPGFNFQPGSSQPSGGGNRGRGAHREVIGIRSSLLEFYGNRPSQLTRRRTRR